MRTSSTLVSGTLTQLEPSGPQLHKAELDSSLVHGLVWSGTAKWASQLFAWSSTIILARILTPSDYGVVSMAMVYLGLLTLVAEFGVGFAVVALRDLSQEQIAQLNGLSVLFGVAGFAVSCVLAYPLGHFFASRQLPAVLVTLSTTLVIASLQSVPAALLQKELRFKLLSFIDGSRAFVLAIVMVVLALAGLGYWTLVLGALLSSLLTTTLVLLRRRHQVAWPRVASLSHAIRFSCHIIASRLAWYCYSNADFVVAGRVLGQAVLGTYTVAWNFANAPVDKLTSFIGGVTPAYFSAVQSDPAALRRCLLRLTEAVSILTFPIMVGLALVARDGVWLVLGAKWQATIRVLQLLAVYACVRSIMPLMPQVLMVTGETRFLMWNGIVSALILPLAFLIGSHWGATGIATAWVLAYPINAVPLYVRTAQKIGLKGSEYLRALRPAIDGILMMAAVVLMLKAAMASQPLPLRLFVEVLAGALVYTTAGLLLYRPHLLGIYRVFRVARG